MKENKTSERESSRFYNSFAILVQRIMRNVYAKISPSICVIHLPLEVIGHLNSKHPNNKWYKTTCYIITPTFWTTWTFEKDLGDSHMIYIIRYINFNKILLKITSKSRDLLYYAPMVLSSCFSISSLTGHSNSNLR